MAAKVEWARRLGFWGKATIFGESLLGILVPGAAVTYYEAEPARKLVADISPDAMKWLDANPWWVLGSALLIAAILQTCQRVKSEKAGVSQFGDRMLAGIIEALGETVAAKAHRLGSALRALRGKKGKVDEALVVRLMASTTQYKELCKALVRIFSTLAPEATWRVSLLSVDQHANLTSFMAFAPDDYPPRSKIAELNVPQSCARRALSERGIVIVEDIAAEARKTMNKRNYVVTDTGLQTGAMLSFPVRHWDAGDGSTFVYVVTVASDLKGSLTQAQKSAYESVLHQVELRLRVEHSCSEMRQMVGGAKT